MRCDDGNTCRKTPHRVPQSPCVGAGTIFRNEAWLLAFQEVDEQAVEGLCPFGHDQQAATIDVNGLNIGKAIHKSRLRGICVDLTQGAANDERRQANMSCRFAKCVTNVMGIERVKYGIVIIRTVQTLP